MTAAVINHISNICVNILYNCNYNKKNPSLLVQQCHRETQMKGDALFLSLACQDRFLFWKEPSGILDLKSHIKTDYENNIGGTYM